MLKILMIGDIVGQPGIEACQALLPRLKQEHQLDFIIANGENAAKDGRGLLDKTCPMLWSLGIDVITSGNHIWRHEQIYPIINQAGVKLIRPANFPSGAPGKGYIIVEHKGLRIAVVNLMGRVFFKENMDCPFRAMDSLLLYLKANADIILVDFHAEATSEKQALGFYLDGRVTGLVGTHTHVQTSDERILPKGSAYITDLGFCGATNSCLGVKKETVINQYLTQMPARFCVELNPPFTFSGVVISVDKDTKQAVAIQRLLLTV